VSEKPQITVCRGFTDTPQIYCWKLWPVFLYNHFVNYFRFHLEKVKGGHVATDTVWAVWYFLCISHSLCNLAKPMFQLWCQIDGAKEKMTVEVCGFR